MIYVVLLSSNSYSIVVCKMGGHFIADIALLFLFLTGYLVMYSLATDQCTQVLKIDCSNSYKPEGNETVCGTDFTVYQNLCFFAQAKCRIPTLSVLYPGHCLHTTLSPVTITKAPPIVSTSPSGSSNTSDFLYTVFCENKDKFACDEDLDPVCGTDDHFYKNDCEFAKAQCVNPTLKTQDLSICKTTSRFRRVLGVV